MHATLSMVGHRSRIRTRRTGRGTRFSTLEIAILVLFAVAVIAAAVAPAVMQAPVVPDETATIKVGEHDTLWGIAGDHPIPGMSTAETVAAIRDLNGVTGGGIVAGQLLVVPVDAGSSASLARR